MRARPEWGTPNLHSGGRPARETRVVRTRPSVRARTVRACVRPAGGLVFAAALALGASACGGDDDAGPSPDDGGAPAGESASPDEGGATTLATVPPDLAEASGNAPAARGAALDEPPGDPDRSPLEGEPIDGGFGEAALSVTRPDGTTLGWCVLLALTGGQRQRGLMEVTDLNGYDGMLFAFPSDNEGGFWMSNTVLPLSIGYFTADGELVSTADMEPCPDGTDCPSYPAAGPYRFALEVPMGELPARGVEEGSTIAVGGSCAS